MSDRDDRIMYCKW